MRPADAARLELARREAARRHFPDFMSYMHPELQQDRFHAAYYRILDLFAHGKIRNLIVTCPPQHGKAICYNTLILTANRGWVRHGDLRVGDYVYAPDGRPVRVLWNSGVYRWPCRRVAFAGGYDIIASYNHEWGVHIPDSSHRDVWYPRIETDAIWDVRRDRNPYIDVASPLRMPERDLPVDPYALGLWLGDGYSRQPRLAKLDEDMRFFESIGVVHIIGPCDRRCLMGTLDGMDSGILRIMSLYDNKHIPDVYLYGSVEQRLALVQGLLDSDGTCDTRGNVEYCTVRRCLADGMMFLLRSLGYKPRIIEGEAKLYGRVTGPRYRILFNPDRDDDVFRLPRKRDRLRNKTAKDRGDKYKHFVTSIEDVGDMDCNCIQVEGGYYLAGENLIPTHNSEGSTRNLPAFLHGIDPDLRICITSYGFPLAQKFNRAVQANIGSDRYARLFPGTVLPKTDRADALKGTYDPKDYPRNLREYGLIGRNGGLIAVGRGGALTGNPVDVGIIDDLYKDDKEASSPVVRQAAVDWYVDVFKTRLHNDSRQLITFTRWHEDDLIGYLRAVCEKDGTPFVEITDFAEFDLPADPTRWYFINFEAIKETGGPTPVDPRQVGELLWPERHGIEKLLDQRRLDPGRFMSLYQGNPMPREGLLYPSLATYARFPGAGMLRGMYMYVDVADAGGDFLCGVVYGHSRMKGLCLVKDVVYTDEGVEVTEGLVVDAIVRNGVRIVWIEANNGGSIFAKNVKKALHKAGCRCLVQSFTQRMNKEARIVTRAADVMQLARFPEDWAVRWPVFYKDLAGFKRKFRANAHDDAADAVTGMVECATGGGSYVGALYTR